MVGWIVAVVFAVLFVVAARHSLKWFRVARQIVCDADVVFSTLEKVMCSLREDNKRLKKAVNTAEAALANQLANQANTELRRRGLQ